MHTILIGDAREQLATLPVGSVQTCVTSPPYFGLRAYLDADNADKSREIGTEQSVEEYVAALVAVFRDVRRVLRNDGTAFVNMGDSYGARKQLLGVPWRFAFAMQDDGWILRQDNVWAKKNCMPESVQDRTTRSHEYVFHFAKQEKYFYDAAAIAEPATQPIGDAALTGQRKRGELQRLDSSTLGTNQGAATRNARSVWTISTRGFPGAHFATFPLEIPRRCILAGTSERGQCSACGTPWVRVVERAKPPKVDPSALDRYGTGEAGVHRKVGGQYQKWLDANPPITTGWAPSCQCDAGDPVPQTVLDPFAGSGTTIQVAVHNGRRAIGIEINPAYAELIHQRLAQRTMYDLMPTERIAKQNGVIS